MPRTQKFSTAIHLLLGKVIHRRLRRAMRWRAPRRRMNNFGERISHRFSALVFEMNTSIFEISPNSGIFDRHGKHLET